MNLQEKSIYHINGNFRYFTSPNSSQNLYILVPGFGDSLNSFSGIYEFLLDEENEVILFDLPGCVTNKDIYFNIGENIKLVTKIVQLYRHKEISIIAHSLGGLIMLLAKTEYDFSLKRIVVIEPTLTKADYGFFKYISEPPYGIGLEAFMESREFNNDYDAEYERNVYNSNLETLKNYVKEVCNNFNQYQNKIIQANFPFTYIYGEQSSAIEYRKAMANYSQITVHGVPKAKHWTHLDNPTFFLKLLSSL